MPMFHFFYLCRLGSGRKIWLLSSYHFDGPPADILRRFTWEGFQTFIGWWISVFTIIRYRDTNIKKYDGAVVICVPRNGYLWGGVSFGTVILGDNRIDASLNNSLFMHEFGHCLQSRACGPIFFFKYGLPSLRSVTTQGHNLHPVEQDASLRAHRYFSKKEGYKGWPQYHSPILEHAGLMKIHWWEYLPPLFPILHLFMLLLPAKRLNPNKRPD